MSAAFGLVKFKTTGNIYYCCYEGTSDTLNTYICTPEECYDEKLDCYCAISYCRELCARKGWKTLDGVTDWDDVEIYSDYGGGSYWDDTGSESAKMLKPTLDQWGDLVRLNEKSGIPEWAKEFLEYLATNKPN